MADSTMAKRLGSEFLELIIVFLKAAIAVSVTSFGPVPFDLAGVGDGSDCGGGCC